MEKISYPNHPVMCIITGPTECGKLVFVSNLILKNLNEFEKTCLYQKLIKYFINCIPIHRIPIILNEEDIDIVIDEVVNTKDFEKTDTEIETFDNIEEIKYAQEYENNSIIILDELNEKGIENDKIQATFKRGRRKKLSIFIISQDYYELPRRTIRANGNVYHLFKPINFRDVQNLYQDKAAMDMPLNEFNCLFSTCWNEKYQPLLLI